MSVNLSKLIELRDKLKRVSDEFDVFLKEFLLKQALDVLAKTKKNSPVDTGLLRNSWTMSDVVRSGDTLTVTISNVVEYAEYVEYGHMNRSRSNWVKGRFMCSLAIIDVKRKMPQRFEREFEIWIASLNLN